MLESGRGVGESERHDMPFKGSLVTIPSKRGNKKVMLFLDRGPGETEFKTVGNPL